MPRTVTVRLASGVVAPLPWTAPIAVTSPAGTPHGSVAGTCGRVVVAGSTAPRVLGAAACHRSSPVPVSTSRDSDRPSGTPSSATPMSVLVVPAAGPLVAATTPS